MTLHRQQNESVVDKRVLVPVASAEEAELLLPLAKMLADGDQQGRVVMLLVLSVEEDEPASVAAGAMAHLRSEVHEVMRRHGVLPLHIHTVVRPAAQMWETLWAYVREEQAHALLLAWPNQVVPTLEHSLLAAPPCAVLLVRAGSQEYTWGQVRQVLLPVRGGPHVETALRVALAIARHQGAEITLLHAIGEATWGVDGQPMAQFAPVLHGLPEIKRSVVAVGSLEEALDSESGRYQVVVLGAPTRSGQATALLSPLLEHALQGLDVLKVIVKSPGPPAQEEGEDSEGQVLYPGTAPVSSSVAVLVDRWFAENTFRSEEFLPLEELVALKEAQGVTISLGLPALNEEATIGQIITTMKTALMEEVPLLDEIVLIDSGSVDYTREIAADLGIPVYIHQKVLPQYGAYHGKGETLWKSLYVLQGDIIVWIDTDIRNIHPRFVYGLLGPLLRNPRIQYVKGFYRRPLKQGSKMVAGGGGRVTELTARPLLNLFFPELSGLIQPLAGEYAGRRQALEQLPFFTGYGVETGLLIDLLSRFGLGAIAQVDLQERIHRNQPLRDLSKMAFAIIQVVIRRLEDRHKIRLLEDFNKTMNLIRYEMGRYWLEPQEIRERERPPIVTLPEYREKFGRRPVEPGGRA